MPCGPDATEPPEGETRGLALYQVRGPWRQMPAPGAHCSKKTGKQYKPRQQATHEQSAAYTTSVYRDLVQDSPTVQRGVTKASPWRPWSPCEFQVCLRRDSRDMQGARGTTGTTCFLYFSVPKIIQHRKRPRICSGLNMSHAHTHTHMHKHTFMPTHRLSLMFVLDYRLHTSFRGHDLHDTSSRI